MITEKDLVEAIAECQGERSPNANTCIKLAAYYTILENIRGERDVPTYSRASEPMRMPLTVEVDSDTEFAEIVSGKRPEEIMPVIDELMVALEVFEPRLYAATLRKLREL